MPSRPFSFLKRRSSKDADMVTAKYYGSFPAKSSAAEVRHIASDHLSNCFRASKLPLSVFEREALNLQPFDCSSTSITCTYTRYSREQRHPQKTHHQLSCGVTRLVHLHPLSDICRCSGLVVVHSARHTLGSSLTHCLARPWSICSLAASKHRPQPCSGRSQCCPYHTLHISDTLHSYLRQAMVPDSSC